MRYAKILSLQQFGVNACSIELECRQSVHLPSFQMLGCSPNHARSVRERVFSALESAGFSIPSRKITIQVLPDCIREGNLALDLAVALAILCSDGIISASRLDGIAVLGGLRLDGKLISVAESLALSALLSQKRIRSAILPYADSQILNANHLNDGGGFHTLKEVIDFLRRSAGKGKRKQESALPKPISAGNIQRIEEIQGHASAKFLLLLAAAGAHHSIIYGPRGSGKSFLIQALPALLPPITKEESQEIQMIYSMSGEFWQGSRPFRAPHSSISRSNLIGGLGKNKFGEMSLAHGGILFLDELLEMNRQVIESLRLPMESGELCLRRGDMHFRLPCRTTLIAASNLCPCGLLGDPRHACACSRTEIRHYRRRISSAMLDRMDLLFSLPAEGAREHANVSTEEYRALASAARAQMMLRQGKANALLRGEEVFQVKSWKSMAQAMWLESCRERAFSHRSAVAVARVALTISDLRRGDCVVEEDLFQALFYRSECI